MSIRNNLTLYGNSVREPEMRGSDRNRVARFTIAVSRGFNGEAGQKDTDFIDCVAFGRTAELVKNLQAKAGLSSLTAKFGIRSLTSTGRAKKSILGTSFRFYPSPPAGKKRKVGTRILLAQFKGIQMKNSLLI